MKPMQRIGLIAAIGLLTFSVAYAAQSHGVTVKSMRFAPASLTISPGDTVVWTNGDDRDHSISAADGSFKSGNIGAGQSYSHTFDKPGTYPYACSYHPRETGTIIVKK